MSELVSLVERVIMAFKKIECFIFEIHELEKVRDLVIKSGIEKYIEIRPVDERYPYIMALVPSRRGLDRDCIALLERMLSQGEISQDEYKKYKIELLEQCILSLETERAKEIVRILEDYYRKLKTSQ
ncbi:MAG: hypothetical protein QW733_00105 [Desulfurococcaceae archaeon]